jgi:hypothetical protein
MATDSVLFSLLERAGQLLREATAGYPNFTKPELLEFAATARALAASAEAEIEARSASFPASLRPALVMQWLPLREVPAGLRVARSWRDESEQYFRRFAQHHGLIRGGDSWQDSVRSYVLDSWRNDRGFMSFQQFVFFYYAKQWAKGDSRFIPIDEAVATWRRLPAERVRRAVVSLVCFGRLNASPTGGGHRFDFQFEGLDDLTPLQLRVLKYHISESDGVVTVPRSIQKIATDLGMNLNQAQTTVDFLVSAGHLASLLDKYYLAIGRFLNGLAPLQRRVLDYYAQHATSDVGLAMNAVAAGLGIDLARVRAAVAFLESEGHLYSTIDDDHHKSTE